VFWASDKSREQPIEEAMIGKERNKVVLRMTVAIKQFLASST